MYKGEENRHDSSSLNPQVRGTERPIKHRDGNALMEMDSGVWGDTEEGLDPEGAGGG